MSSQKSQTVSSFSEQDLQKMTSDVVFYLLAQESKRIPTKRVDLFKACNLNTRPSEIRERVMKEVKEKLLRLFGTEVLEMTPKKGSSGTQYLLINKVVRPNNSRENYHLTWDDSETAKIGLLFSILALIFMSPDSVIDDKVLFAFLKKLSVYEDSMAMDRTVARKIRTTQGVTKGVKPEVYALFGNVRDLLNKEWGSKQHYLEVKEIPGTEEEALSRFEYRWGERAEIEIKKSRILTKVCMMYDCPPSYFNEQRQKILEGEDEEDKKILFEFEKFVNETESNGSES